MKYKVGDRVRIMNKRAEWIWERAEIDCWLGKIMTVDNVVENDSVCFYKMKEDGGKWYWYEDMIAGLAEPELTAVAVVKWFMDHYRDCDWRKCFGVNCDMGALRALMPAEEVVERIQAYIAGREKKEPEIETVDTCRIIEILLDGRKRCVHEEDVKPDPELPYGSVQLAVEEVLKRHCLKHKGKFIAEYEIISRVKAVN